MKTATIKSHLFADDYPDWIVKDGSIAATGPSGQENRPVLGVWSGRSGLAHVYVRPHCSLACLHLVRDSGNIFFPLNALIGPLVIFLSIFRYAIGNAERPILQGKIGWLDALAADTQQHYTINGTGGPSIKVRFLLAFFGRRPFGLMQE